MKTVMTIMLCSITILSFSNITSAANFSFCMQDLKGLDGFRYDITYNTNWKTLSGLAIYNSGSSADMVTGALAGVIEGDWIFMAEGQGSTILSFFVLNRRTLTGLHWSVWRGLLGGLFIKPEEADFVPCLLRSRDKPQVFSMKKIEGGAVKRIPDNAFMCVTDTAYKAFPIGLRTPVSLYGIGILSGYQDYSRLQNKDGLITGISGGKAAYFAVLYHNGNIRFYTVKHRSGGGSSFLVYGSTGTQYRAPSNTRITSCGYLYR